MKVLAVISIVAAAALYFVLGRWTPRIPRDPWATAIPTGLVIVFAVLLIVNVVVA